MEPTKHSVWKHQRSRFKWEQWDFDEFPDNETIASYKPLWHQLLQTIWQLSSAKANWLLNSPLSFWIHYLECWILWQILFDPRENLEIAFRWTFLWFLQILSAPGPLQMIFSLPRIPFPPSISTFFTQLIPTYAFNFCSNINFWLYRLG